MNENPEVMSIEELEQVKIVVGHLYSDQDLEEGDIILCECTKNRENGPEFKDLGFIKNVSGMSTTNLCELWYLQDSDILKYLGPKKNFPELLL